MEPRPVTQTIDLMRAHCAGSRQTVVQLRPTSRLIIGQRGQLGGWPVSGGGSIDSRIACRAFHVTSPLIRRCRTLSRA